MPPFCKLASTSLRLIGWTDYKTQNCRTENKDDKKIKAHNNKYSA